TPPATRRPDTGSGMSIPQAGTTMKGGAPPDGRGSPNSLCGTATRWFAGRVSGWTSGTGRSVVPTCNRPEPARAGPSPPSPTPAPRAPLPEPGRRGTTALGCAPAYLALPVLAVAASAIGNTRTVRVKRGWEEPCIV